MSSGVHESEEHQLFLSSFSHFNNPRVLLCLYQVAFAAICRSSATKEKAIILADSFIK
jgi:hypothetical protein